jgi:hypothetical protein
MFCYLLHAQLPQAMDRGRPSHNIVADWRLGSNGSGKLDRKVCFLSEALPG